MKANRAILMTAPGAAAIAVIRVVGPKVGEFLKDHFSKTTVAKRPMHGDFVGKDGAVIDDPVVIFDPDRGLADINVHGGPWIVQRVLDLARSEGFEIVRCESDRALPDEAVDADSILEREILTHLHLPKTLEGIRILLAQAELWPQAKQHVQATNASSRSETIDTILSNHLIDHILHPPAVAIIGIPNAGKSTLANQLFGQERVITADVPGTTRDWVGELANIDGLAVILIDTPGQRATDDPIEAQAIDASRAVIAQAPLVVIVLDPTQDFAPQREMIEKYPNAILVLNKTDKKSYWNARIEVIPVIATRGFGVDGLRRKICEAFGFDPKAPRACAWTQRQRDILSNAKRDVSAIEAM